MQVTLKEIAEKAGFSVTTVSRALGGFSDVNEKTRQYIMQIADELGYQPNLIARQLRSQRTYTIGLIIPAAPQSIEDDFFSILIRGVTHTAARRQYDVLVSAQLPEANEMDAYYRIVGGNRVDGMILARTYHDDPRIAYLRSLNHPFVVSGRAAPDQVTDFPYIDVDSRLGISELVTHFVAYGHTDIGLILPPKNIAYTPYRLDGYRDGLAVAGIPYRAEYVVYGDMKRQGGYTAAGQLLEANPQLTAIVACNDLMGIGAMNAIHERGLLPGADIAVGGFDGIPAAEHATPALTTVRQPIYTIGEQVTEILIKVINNEPLAETGILLKPELVIRESSGQPRR
ncbi:MAG: LacI family DNA-binding transcriptional regulator [Anaerolineaceae bacterium]|nr:LacI family DNA-binding transcriptional regulator [Anaerolineaceae bacterium]